MPSEHISGAPIAERTLCSMMDLPLKRSSSAALSVRIATRSFTTWPTMDLGTWRADAEPSPSRLFEIRGIGFGAAGLVEEDGHAVHVHHLEGEVHDRLEQLVHVLLPGQRLRDLEEQLELLGVAGGGGVAAASGAVAPGARPSPSPGP